MTKSKIATYLVGGAVRDSLLGIIPKDLDYVVVGATFEEMIASGFKQVGADFPVFLHPENGYEYAMARTEVKTGPGYLGFDTRFTPDVTLEEDLERRDLSINSMAEDEHGNIVDPFNGRHDLKNRILRHTSHAFIEDPVRVLRIARFAARYTDFTIHSDTIELMRKMVSDGELDSLTPERVFAEFKKGLMENQPSRMFRVLKEVGCDKVMPAFLSQAPEFSGMIDAAARDKESLEVRFAIAASGFRKNDYENLKISSDCAEISALLNGHITQFRKYVQLTNEERISLFMKLDCFRRRQRAIEVFNAAYHVMHFTGAGLASDIFDDLHNARTVDAGEIASAITDKSKIKDSIFDARVKAITAK